jgi:hypothetical protein
LKIFLKMSKTIPSDIKTSFTKSDLIKSLVKEGLYNSLAQAIIKILQTSHFVLKVFLFVFVFSSSGFAAYMVIRAFGEFFSYQVITTSRTIYETPTLFPKITFCNVNKYTTQFAYSVTLKKSSDYLNDQDFNDTYKQSLGHSLNDILIFCQFNYKDCNISDFIWTYDSTYGNCYTFNSGFHSNGSKVNLKQSGFVGSDYGLQLTFYINFYQELTSFNSNSKSDYKGGFGALIRIDNSSYLTDHGSDGILISPGTQTDIIVYREFNSILPKPYSNCEIELDDSTFQLNSELIELIAKSKYRYSQQLCFSQCLQKLLIEKRNCTDPSMESLFQDKIQCNKTMQTDLFNDHVSNDFKYIKGACVPLCPLECYQTIYKTSISSYQLLGDYFKEEIVDKPNLLDDFKERPDSFTAKNSFVKVNVFYDSLSYKKTWESPKMDIVSLLASIGGNLGLFLGISFFSLCELIEVIIEIYYIKGK